MKAFILGVTTILGFATTAFAEDSARLNAIRSIEQYVSCSTAISPATQYIDYKSIDGSDEGSEALKLPDQLVLLDGTAKELRTISSKYRKTLIRQLSAVTAPTVVTAAELNNGRKSLKENFRKGLISANHPCATVQDGTVRSAFRDAGDAVVEGFIRYNQKTAGYQKGEHTSASTN